MEEEQDLYDFSNEGIDPSQFEGLTPDGEVEEENDPNEEDNSGDTGNTGESNDGEANTKNDDDSTTNPNEDDLEDLDELDNSNEGETEGDDYNEDDSFTNTVEALKHYNVDYELSKEHNEELAELSGEDKIKRYVQIQSELKDAEISGRINETLSNVNEEIKPLLNIALNGGNLNDVIALAKEKASIGEITKEKLADNQSLQIKVVTQDLKNSSSFTDEEIEEFVEKWKDEDKLEAKSYISADRENSRVKKLEQSEKDNLENQRQARQDQIDKWQSDIRKTIKDSNEIIPGKALTTKEKKELEESILTPIKTKDGVFYKSQLEYKKDPIGYAVKLNHLINLGIFSNNEAWEDIMKVGKTKQVKSVLKGIAGSTVKGKGVRSKKTTETEDLLMAAFAAK